MQNSFVLGEQPQWIGIENCTEQPIELIEELLKDPIVSLIERGYAVVELQESIINCYSDFHSIWEEWTSNNLEMKSKYAIYQFGEDNNRTPNQYHGFSVVDKLKEQFMIRAGGKNAILPTPGVLPNCGKNFGDISLSLLIHCDRTCRNYISQVLKRLNLPKSNLDNILDPVMSRCKNIISRNNNTETSYSNYLPDEYISSSIMDNFHYFNHFQQDGDTDERFINNHGSHTDSGLMTLVVCTDVPGLEVKDQKLDCWISLEQMLHQYAKEKQVNHRKYATIFWGDSCEYLDKTGQCKLNPSFHRVAQCKGERYSVVFKQRTCVCKTPPRYQEDYHLAVKQMKIIDSLESKRKKLVILLAVVIVFSTCYSFF